METIVLWVFVAIILVLAVVVFIQRVDIKDYKKTYDHQNTIINDLRAEIRASNDKSPSKNEIDEFTKAISTVLSLFNQAGGYIKMKGIEAQIHKDTENEVKLVLGECCLSGKVKGMKDEAETKGFVDMLVGIIKDVLGK